MENHVAVVTGGSGAVGAAVVQKLLAEGAQVLVADQVPPALSDNKLKFFPTDVTNEQSIAALVTQAVSIYGTVHALFNVAGGFKYGPGIDELELADWDALINLNLTSAFLSIKHILPLMKQQKYGRIVSVSARSGLRGDPMVGPYAVSKGGVILLTQSVAEENKMYGITVNAVLPSIVDTPANRLQMPESDFKSWVAPADLAEVMVFLGSERARAVTGACLPVYNLA